MCKKRISIDSVDDAICIADIADRCNFKIYINDGNLYTDARSLIGIFNLDLMKKIEISYAGFNHSLENYILAH